MKCPEYLIVMEERTLIVFEENILTLERGSNSGEKIV
jgi:hypothetical protein